ncbi:DNA-binding protein WhiA [Pseudalkalibacillus sp. Hm43]|uniref:DNA-binding protein WhiA n=1 Tax=Pseudalkalibacillus sp. Hm43 TaxID=3450742 RepID=UPI003F41F458
MSFASDTKKELTKLELKSCCSKAELSALIRMNGSISLANREIILDIPTENAAIARRIYTLIKQLYSYPAELLVRKKMRLKKNNVYIVRIKQDSRTLLRELDIIDDTFSFKRDVSTSITKKSCCKRSYLRGAFLAGGSLNHPESAYHLEIFSMYEEHSQSLLNLINSFGLNAKMLERKKGFIIYMKEGEKISEFLTLIGAHNALLQFEDVRIMKDMRNSVNRLVNCETANLNKTVGASMRQVENIKLIEREVGLETLPDKLREIAELRVKYQDVSLKELGDLVSTGPISKSGINHRLRKLDELANKIRLGQM